MPRDLGRRHSGPLGFAVEAGPPDYRSALVQAFAIVMVPRYAARSPHVPGWPCWSAECGAARGFSVIELIVVMGIAAVIATIAVFQLNAAQPSFRSDGAMRVVLAQMRTARELAITQRRFMRVTFIDPNRVEIHREEFPGPSTTVVQSTVLEGNMQYLLLDDVPDTPDGFGNDSAIDFQSAATVKFSPDGLLIDQDGVPINGSVFLALASVARSARAITVLGSTGRIRAYRWDGRGWRLV